MSATAASLPASISTLQPSAVRCDVPEMDSMPAVLQQLLTKVEARRCEIRRQAFWEGVKFWSLKAPAVIIAAGSGVIAVFSNQSGLPAALVSGLFGICVALDGMIHPGEHRNAYLRAANALCNLKDSIDFWWTELKQHGVDDAAAQILAKAEKQWKKITDDLEGTRFTTTARQNKSTSR